MSKVFSVNDLNQELQQQREAGRSIVHCHGTFDLLHTGHIKHLQRAAEEGDILVATLTADAFVNKGPDRPVFTETLRAENLAALECVNYVAINHEKTAVNLIELFRPDVYVKGGEFREGQDVTGQIQPEKLAVEANGGRVFFTDEVTFSSTQLLNDHFDVFTDDVRAYLSQFKQYHSADSVIEAVQGLKNKRVLVLGDAIIDEYHYITTMGQTGKGSTLAVRFNQEEQFAGGAIAVANHVAGFAGEVTLVTGLGTEVSHEDFVCSHLRPNVDPVFIYYPGETLRKRRFVEHNMKSLFEVYFGLDQPVGEDVSTKTCDWLTEHASDYDLVIVPDFGNGFITLDVAQTISREAKFLAVNTQVNSMNRGFHVATRYHHADYISLNEPELRMASRDQYSPLQPLVNRIGLDLDAKYLAVTRGEEGVLCRNFSRDETHSIPALSNQVVDRIGAGDAFLSLSGLCLGGGLPADIAGFVGSATAALDVQIVCNREPVSPAMLFKFITTLLK